jgi:signal transduction histidine kinase
MSVMPQTDPRYAEVLAARIADQSQVLSERWLAELAALLTVDTNSIFPTGHLLDHIPLLIRQIAGYLQAPADEAIAANTSVIEKAQELGQLRHRQQASVHQILREYDILAAVLENFVTDETSRLPVGTVAAVDALAIMQRLGHAIRTLVQTTVDTFVAEYTATISQQTERLENFNRGLTHELRNPLGTLRFAVAALGREDVTTDKATYTRMVDLTERSVQRLVERLKSLEQMAFTEQSVDAPTHQRVSVSSIAGDVARQLEQMAAQRGVEVRVADDLPELITEAAQLELVLINLVSNGIKYCDPSKPSRFVEICRGADAPDTHVLCIRDNGLGIPEALQSSVFVRFVRAHKERDEELGVDGSGLGLAIVEESIRILGGSIRFESVEGRGTAFYLTLPATIV